MKIVILIVLCCFTTIVFSASWSADMNAEKWNKNAKDTIKSYLERKPNRNIAKNLILYLGDGMGISTVTAGRILKGQLKNSNGEEEITYIDGFDHVALSKTYNIDAQTPDSAGTATAYLSGVKTRIGVIGLDGNAIFGNCKSTKGTEITSILHWAHKAGKSVGIVTTTRITHATPAASYAHTPHRDWEAFDGKNFQKQHADEGCKDIAAQLIDENSFINVIFGGGRKVFLPDTIKDNMENKTGIRIDNRNLINEWLQKMQADSKSSKFISNAADLRNLDTDKYDHVFGLFAYDHLSYEFSRPKDKEPSLSEMTEKAIRILSKNKNGYFLLVEGGKIDHGHHDSSATNALHDFVAFDEAVGKGVELVSKEDTLLVITADHSHVFTIGGYSNRGNPIFGLVNNSYGSLSDDGLTFTSLSYGNGPGALKEKRKRNLTAAEVENPNYIQESAVFLYSETHGGEDVAVYAKGPMGFLMEGTVEQSFIAHAMAYSACIGAYDTQDCRNQRGYVESSYYRMTSNKLILIVLFLLNIILI